MTLNPFQTALNVFIKRSSNNCIIYVIFKYLLFLLKKKHELLVNEGQYSDVLYHGINSVREPRVVSKQLGSDPTLKNRHPGDKLSELQISACKPRLLHRMKRCTRAFPF